jgi:hypothetical protein
VLESVSKTTPFKHDPATGICNLQCSTTDDPLPWSNVGSTHRPAQSGFDDLCTKPFCKDWDPKVVKNRYGLAVSDDVCTACWSGTDLQSWSTWDARTWMKEDNIKGMDLTLPYDWNAIGACVPICKTGYFRDFGANTDQL